MLKKIGMVIINYNDYETTKRLINNIKDYNCLEYIVVVDNNSSDDSYSKLKKMENKKLIVVKNKNRGYASGLNFGARVLIEKIGRCGILFSNSDIIIKKENDLKVLLEDLNDDITVVGPVVEENKVSNRGWHLPTTNQEILFNIPLLSRYFKKKYLPYPKKNYERDLTEVEVVSGCFFLADSSFLEDIGYFDEGTFLYYEEQIFAETVRKKSKKEVIDNRVTIIHNHSVSVDKSLKKLKKQKILKESQRYYAKKYKKANLFQMFLLYVTDYTYRFILLLMSLFRR